jgi:hypothetical protein
MLEPPDPHGIKFQISAGDRVEITPEIHEAFERLVLALRNQDVGGYTYDSKCTTREMMCIGNANCRFESQNPCFIEYKCDISSLR